MTRLEVDRLHEADRRGRAAIVQQDELGAVAHLFSPDGTWGVVAFARDPERARRECGLSLLDRLAREERCGG